MNQLPPVDSFADEVKALGARIRASMGPRDAAHLLRLYRIERSLKWIGRAVAAFVPGPGGILLGGLLLAIQKQLAIGPLGHDIYHGAWEGVPGAERFAKERWRWDAPVEPDIWREMHNRRHHAHTGVAHRDYDAQFALLRVNPHLPRFRGGRFQGWWGLASLPLFTHIGHLQYLGAFDGLARRMGQRTAQPQPVAARQALRRWARWMGRYVLDHYLIGPLIFGPFALRVVLAELLAGRLRDLALFYFAFATHAGPETAWLPEDHRSSGRDGWLRDRIAVSYNSRLPRWASLILDAVDQHIEHHVFPMLPSHRLAEAGLGLREICRRHGVPYRVESIPARIWTTLREFFRLAG